MKIYSYVVRYDSGFAPNPFWGYCTLATCKPKIRQKAKKGDWVMGTGSTKTVGNDRLVYAMKMTEVMPLEDYWNDNRFQKKKPCQRLKRSVGDNIYYRDENGKIRQYFPSLHSHPNREDMETKERDLKGENVLISESGNFYYFGREAPKIPEALLCLVKKGPFHKCKFSQEVIDRFLQWIQREKPGIHGFPSGYFSKENCIRDDKRRCL